MGITTKYIKQTALLLSAAFLTLNIYSRNQDSNLDMDISFLLGIRMSKVINYVNEEAEEMAKMCKNHDLGLEKCENKCLTDYSKQREDYLMRTSTFSAAKMLFTHDKRWHYKTDYGDKIFDDIETYKAYALWKDPGIRRETQKRLAEYNENAQFFLRHGKEMLIEKLRKKEIENLRKEIVEETGRNKKDLEWLIEWKNRRNACEYFKRYIQ